MKGLHDERSPEAAASVIWCFLRFSDPVMFLPGSPIIIPFSNVSTFWSIHF